MPQIDSQQPPLHGVYDGEDVNDTLAIAADDTLGEDVPPESFWLSKDAEYDWFDRHAFYERKDSAKGNSNSTNLNPLINPGFNPGSHRLSVSLKSKASLIGLPKSQKTNFVDPKRRNCNKSVKIRLFPKRSGSAGESASIPAAEPGSPKVSCMGRVRSKRGRRRSNSRKRIQALGERSDVDGERKQRKGFYSKVLSFLRPKNGRDKKPARLGSRKVVEVVMEPVNVEPKRKSVSLRVREVTVSCDPQRLGGMQRFSSGRRSTVGEDGAVWDDVAR